MTAIDKLDGDGEPHQNFFSARILLIQDIRARNEPSPKFLAAESSSICPNVVVCCLLFVCDQVRKLLANCLLTAC